MNIPVKILEGVEANIFKIQHINDDGYKEMDIPKVLIDEDDEI